MAAVAVISGARTTCANRRQLFAAIPNAYQTVLSSPVQQRRQRCGNASDKYMFSADRVLSKDNISTTMSRFQATQAIRMQTEAPARKAAVLIPLCRVDGEMALLYTLRTSHLRSHNGQVSFPGGMQDRQDRSLVRTALRETQEELGVDPADITVWGEGNTVVGRSDVSILPVVGHIRQNFKELRLDVNRNEVQDVFTVPLQVLCDPKQIGHTQFRTGYSTPVFKGGKHRIWGVTGMLTYLILKSLFPKEVYNHRVQFIQLHGNKTQARKII